MKISTRGRYGLRMMIDIAEHVDDGPISLDAIADRQGISFKYAESIMRQLVKAKLVTSSRGKMGGYTLSKKTNKYTLEEILTATEGDLYPLDCLSCTKPVCPKQEKCKARKMWSDYYRIIKDYFSSISLSSLVGNSSFYEDGLGI